MKIDTAKLVNAPTLLEILFDDNSRPTLRWLQAMRTKRAIPYFKIGHSVFFDPEKVRAALARRNEIRSL
ncbi:MAG TPA: hypothetical protein VH598_11570 [Verrucomicrobiae bacterium]|nr:hypothetical protein [Verrucomicrobiae bacterium]